MVSVAYDFLSVVICSNHISVLHLLRDIKTCLSIKNLMLQKMTVKIPLVLLRQLQKIYKKVWICIALHHELTSKALRYGCYTAKHTIPAFTVYYGGDWGHAFVGNMVTPPLLILMPLNWYFYLAYILFNWPHFHHYHKLGQVPKPWKHTLGLDSIWRFLERYFSWPDALRAWRPSTS